MKKIYFFVIVFTSLMLACDENRVFEEHIEPHGNLEWSKADKILIDVDIIDTTIKYDQILALRFAQGYSFSTCAIQIVETSPSGKESIHKFNFITADDKGYLGEGMGDIFDLEQPWFEKRIFKEAGTYRYSITHEMNDDIIHMVMEVGMILDKSTNPL